MRRTAHPRSRAQAVSEFALILPLMLLIATGTYDLGRAYSNAISAIAGARAGARAAITDANGDVGFPIRNEPSTRVVAPTSTYWGNTAPGGSLDWACDTSSVSCGDPSGCPTPFSGTVVACFSVRSVLCPSSTPCTGALPASAYGAWGQRVPAGHDPNAAVQVITIYKFSAATPAVSALFGSGGAIYISQSAIGFPIYS